MAFSASHEDEDDRGSPSRGGHGGWFGVADGDSEAVRRGRELG
jgi:hypothetical protein